MASLFAVNRLDFRFKFAQDFLALDFERGGQLATVDGEFVGYQFELADALVMGDRFVNRIDNFLIGVLYRLMVAQLREIFVGYV